MSRSIQWYTYHEFLLWIVKEKQTKSLVLSIFKGLSMSTPSGIKLSENMLQSYVRHSTVPTVYVHRSYCSS